jgi:hypothetical protein
VKVDFDRLRERLEGELADVRERGCEGAAAERLTEFASDVSIALDHVEQDDPALFAQHVDLRDPMHEAFRIARQHTARERVEELLGQTSADSPDPAWEAIGSLADLEQTERAQYVQRFKHRAKRSLDLREFKAALRERVSERDRAMLHGYTDGRPSVVVGDVQLRELSDESLRVLVEANDPPRVFERSGQLVQVRRDERGELDEAMNVVAAVAQRWQSLAGAWLALERAADLGRNHATRLDIPKFPLDVTGDLDAMPIPPSLADVDPTITSAA